jgi:hypothetical protein
MSFQSNQPGTDITLDEQLALSQLAALGAPGTVLTVNPAGTGLIYTSVAGGSQTPWTSNIDGGGYSLTNVNNIDATYLKTGGNPALKVSADNVIYAGIVGGDTPSYSPTGIATDNFIMGKGAGSKLVDGTGTGSYNFIWGEGAGHALTGNQANGQGADNQLVGRGAGTSITIGHDNILYAYQAGRYITTGFSNTISGNNGGLGLTGNANNNTIFGANSGINSDGNFLTLLGAEVELPVAGNYQTVIGGLSTTNAFIRGATHLKDSLIINPDETTSSRGKFDVYGETQTTNPVANVTGSTTLTFNYGSGVYEGLGSTYSFAVYASIGGVFSVNPLVITGTDNGSDVYVMAGSWDAVTGADFYRVVVTDPQFFAAGDYYFDTPYISFEIGAYDYGYVDDISAYYTSGNTVTPNSVTSPLSSGFYIGTDGTWNLNSSAGTSGKVLTSNGAGVAPTWQNVDLSAYVPYTGATTNVDLGAFGLTADSLIKLGGTSSQFLKADGSVDSSTYLTQATELKINIRNETGSTITKGKAVYVSGFNNLPLVRLADNTIDGREAFIAIVTANIPDESNGVGVLFGAVDMDTDAIGNVGDDLYLSTSGNIVNAPPTTGAVISIGVLTIKDNNGSIQITKPQHQEYITMASGVDSIVRMGDSIGTNKVSYRNYANTEVASLNSLGRFGLGITSPLAKLHISGTLGSGFNGSDITGIRLTNTPSGKTYRIASGIGGIVNSNFTIDDVTAGVSRFNIDTNGNIGIGHTGQTSKLDVVNTGTGFLSALAVRNYGSYSNSTGISFYGIDTGSNVQEVARITGQSGYGFGAANTNSGRIAFSTKVNAGALTEKVCISSSGNFGIGTDNPTNTLSLGNTQAQKIWIENTVNTVVGRALTISAGSTVTGGTANMAGGDLILSSGAGKGTGASSISFFTGTTLTSGSTLQTLSEKMTILGNGNVGIGTTTPTEKLHAVGNVLIEGVDNTLTIKEEAIITDFPLMMMDGERNTGGKGFGLKGGMFLFGDADGLGSDTPQLYFIDTYDPNSIQSYLEQNAAGDLNLVPSSGLVKVEGRLNVSSLPTSSAGLSAGDIWCDTTGGLNVLKIV